MKRLPVLCGVVWILLQAVPAQGQFFRWLAFGDSITLGNYDFEELGGYPGRLDDLLNCSPGVCEVFNAGESGEKTFEGVTRIDGVLDDDGPFDVMMLMEGTNDIFRELSFESMVTNLTVMANKAQSRGVETVHASIIWYHPAGTYGTSKDDEVEDLRDEMEALAAANDRYFVDIWDVLCPASHPDVHDHNQSDCFDLHYSDVPDGDDRGHPIGWGYTMMANAFYNGVNTVPSPGVSTPTSPTGVITEDRPLFEWTRESPTDATWYRFLLEDDQGVRTDLWLKTSIYCNTTTCAYQGFLPLENGDYSWRIRGRNPAGLGSWTADTDFSIQLDVIFQDGFESGDTGAWTSEEQ